MTLPCTPQKRLHAENFARAAAKRTREEAEARDKATAAAAAAAAAKHDADNYLRRLQKQHIEQVTEEERVHGAPVRTSRGHVSSSEDGERLSAGCARGIVWKIC